MLYSVILLVVTTLGFFGSSIWVFDILSNFRLQYAQLALVLFVVLALMRQRSLVTYVVLVLSFVINGQALFPYYWFAKDFQKEAQPLKAISINLNSSNNNSEGLIHYLESKDVDFLFLYELTPRWAKIFSKLKDRFVDAKAILQEDNFGIGIVSKFPIVEVQVLRDETPMNIPALIVKVASPKGVLKLVAAHPFPPISPDGRQARDKYLSLLGEKVDATKTPVLLCGDLNTTPWSPVFTKLVKKGKLNPIYGFGAPATWPTGFPVGLPLDSCLHSAGVGVVRYQRGPYWGSDHYPIEVDFVLLKNTGHVQR